VLDPFPNRQLYVVLAFELTGMWQPHYWQCWVTGIDLSLSTAWPHLPWLQHASATFSTRSGTVSEEWMKAAFSAGRCVHFLFRATGSLSVNGEPEQRVWPPLEQRVTTRESQEATTWLIDASTNSHAIGVIESMGRATTRSFATPRAQRCLVEIKSLGKGLGGIMKRRNHTLES
jgi:hypothetical protein